jgi:hypothetical protein
MWFALSFFYDLSSSAKLHWCCPFSLQALDDAFAVCKLFPDAEDRCRVLWCASQACSFARRTHPLILSPRNHSQLINVSPISRLTSLLAKKRAKVRVQERRVGIRQGQMRTMRRSSRPNMEGWDGPRQQKRVIRMPQP